MKLIYSILILMVFFCGCKNKQESVSPIVKDIHESVYASGIIKSKSQYQSYAKVSGLIDEIYVKEGDKVQKGQVILSISNRAQKLNEENASLAANFANVKLNEGKLNDAKLAMELARNKMRNDSTLLERQKNLWQQSIGAKVDLEQRELAYENSKAAYFSAVVRYDDLQRQLNFSSSQSNKNLEISRTMVDDYVLKSEIDGMVYLINNKVGEFVGPQMPLAVVGSANEFILEMQIDEYDILQVQAGQQVLVTMDSYKGKVFEARVTKINPIMNERSKTFTVEAEFMQIPPKLYPNLNFEANIVLQTKEKALLVPRNFLKNDSVALLPSGEEVVVKTGLRDYQYIEILEGLNEKSVIVKPK